MFFWFIFFFKKKSREKEIKKKWKIIDEMIGVFNLSEVYGYLKRGNFSNGKFYCSKECLKKNRGFFMIILGDKLYLMKT